jgi:hypothetical protein
MIGFEAFESFERMASMARLTNKLGEPKMSTYVKFLQT